VPVAVEANGAIVAADVSRVLAQALRVGGLQKLGGFVQGELGGGEALDDGAGDDGLTLLEVDQAVGGLVGAGQDARGAVRRGLHEIHSAPMRYRLQQ